MRRKECGCCRWASRLSKVDTCWKRNSLPFQGSYWMWQRPSLILQPMDPTPVVHHQEDRLCWEQLPQVVAKEETVPSSWLTSSVRLRLYGLLIISIPLLMIALVDNTLTLLASVFHSNGLSSSSSSSSSSSYTFSLLFPYSLVSLALWVLICRRSAQLASNRLHAGTGSCWPLLRIIIHRRQRRLCRPFSNSNRGNWSDLTGVQSKTIVVQRTFKDRGARPLQICLCTRWWWWWWLKQRHRRRKCATCTSGYISNGVGYVKSSVRLPTSSPPKLEAKEITNWPLGNRRRRLNSSSLLSVSSSISSASSYILMAILLLFGSLAPVAVSATISSAASSVSLESLNPWLSADGGLILRAVTGQSNLNWVRPNPGSCKPKPPVPACSSNRYCPTSADFVNRATVFRGNSASSSNSNRPYSPFPTSGASGHQSPRASIDEDGDDLISIVSSASETNSSQCLPYLHSSSNSNAGDGVGGPSPAECICDHADGAKRIDALRRYHLYHCYHYNLWHVLSDTMREGITRSRSQCYAYLEAVERLDNLAAHFVCQFEDILRRYDCAQTFSGKSSCQRCKVSYLSHYLSTTLLDTSFLFLL